MAATMTTTTIVVVTIGAYALVLGLIGLISERHATRSAGRPIRQLPLLLGTLGVVLGSTTLLLVAVSAAIG